jgi:uncharacterized protein (TIGR03643 family)
MDIIVNLSAEEKNRIMEMAWEDGTPFEAILNQFGVSEKEVIRLMRREMKGSSFRMWRKRVQGREAKHAKRAPSNIPKFKSKSQRSITHNKISKR